MDTLAAAPSRQLPITSPVTGGRTELAETYDSAVIVARYAADNVDVAPYFAGMEKVELRRCLDTGYRFFHPPGLAGEASFYEQLYAPGADGSQIDYRHWSQDYQFAYDRLIEGEQLLDVGCGNGYFVERAVEKAKAKGLDGNPHAQRKCLERGLEVALGSLADYAAAHPASVDTLCSFQVVEHIYEAGAFFRAARAVLRPGGRMIMTTPNNEPYFNRFNKYETWNLPPHHIGMWDMPSLLAAGRHFGFEPVEQDYLDTHSRPILDAYLHSRQMMGVTSDMRKHKPGELMKIILGLPITLPSSLATYVLRGGVLARTTLAVVFSA